MLNNSHIVLKISELLVRDEKTQTERMEDKNIQRYQKIYDIIKHNITSESVIRHPGLKY